MLIATPVDILQNSAFSGACKHFTSNAVPRIVTSCLSAASLPIQIGVTATAGSPAGSMPTAAMALRGGAVAAAASTATLNLSREGYCLGVLGTYATVTTLVMNSNLRLYTSTKFPKAESIKERIAPSLFFFLSSLCVVSGAFTAILFQLLGIYSKTALGIMNDEGYHAFTAATAVYRRWGFRCFLTSLGSFVGTFMISLYNKIEEGNRVEQLIFAITLFLIAIGAYNIKVVLDLATKLIFAPEFMKARLE